MPETDTDFLDEIEDFLVNNFGEDDEVTGSEAIEMLEHICSIIDRRNNA